ncbi:hypothetical protein PtrM4_120720 [Pyrenophora tritici-repentis]|uniref:Uncharacterized protein n=1 Tax=Pyrenophora tritici-repentis TaxID=45151 RepID=A0A317ARB7_9PLEO|nr:hypothetical protein PtrM4_120720 [Pyrenophora tritici-repentis]
MAKAVIKVGTVEVPDFLCDMTKRACKNRAGWSLALHAMQFDDEGELMDILLEVHTLLHDATFHEHDAKSGPISQERSPIDASGIVSGIDGLSLQSADQQSSTIFQRPHVQPVIFDRGDEEFHTEFSLGLSLFFWDLMARRDIVKNFWRRYPDLYETTIPGVVTDVFIGQVRALERDFEDTMVWPFKFPKAQYPTPLLPALFCARFERTAHNVREKAKDVLYNEIKTKPFDHTAALGPHCKVALLAQHTACQYYRKQTQHLSNAELIDVGITSFEHDQRYYFDMVGALKLLQSVVAETTIDRADNKLDTPRIMDGLEDTITSFSKTIAEIEKAKEPFPRGEAEKKCYEDLGILQERLREWVIEDKVEKWTRGMS